MRNTTLFSIASFETRKDSRNLESKKYSGDWSPLEEDLRAIGKQSVDYHTYKYLSKNYNTKNYIYAFLFTVISYIRYIIRTRRHRK